MNALTCPVCQGQMRETTRNNVTIDTCTQCRGVWLDRGELDRLLADMRSDVQEGPRHYAPDPRQQQRHYDHDDDDDYRRHQGHPGSSHGYPHRKKSKMESFMDIFD